MADAAPHIVLVTGAAAGIGLATARAFAAAGDVVVLTDLAAAPVERLAANLGDRHVGLAMDVADEAAVVAGVAAVAARFGRIDVLVNNAGIIDPNARRVLDKPIEEVRRLIAVNLEGAYVAAREAGRVMRAQGSGSIVNLSSGAALAALPGRTPYSMTKAAILGLTRALASEWATGGVRVNAVLPGYVRTEILASLELAGKFDPRAAGAAVPLGRLAEPEEIAAVIRHIAGARYLSGASILADGGFAAFGGRGAAAGAPVSGRVPAGAVLVTGGASGVGAAIADRFVAQGARVVVTDRDAGAVVALPADRTGIVLDVTDAAAVDAAIRDLGATIGPIAVLVAAAGIGDTPEPAVAGKLAEFRRAFDGGMTGTLIVARAVARGMVAAGGGGAIVAVSPVAPAGGMPQRAAHGAAHAAVTMLVKSLACEWAEHGIRVNAVVPESMGDAADVADAVAFLASDAASYVTGASHAVGGGTRAACGAA